MHARASRRANFRQSDATRALRAAVAAGLRPSGFKIDPNGAIVVQFDEAPIASLSNPWDEVLK